MNGRKAKKTRKEVRKILITSRELANKVYDEFRNTISNMSLWGRLSICFKILKKKL